mgnify:CR=1 FL=1
MRKQSLFQISKRDTLPLGKALLIRGGILLLALVFCGLITTLLTGQNPISVYGTILSGAFGSSRRIGVTARNVAILLGISLAVTPAFKMRFWNIGAEGQIIMGAIFATYFGVFHGDWPKAVLLPVMFLAGIVGGGLWGAIPAFFKTRFGTNETLLTLMLNYIALYLIMFLREGPWRDPSNMAFPQIATIGENARLGEVFGVHAGWIVALVLVVLVFVYMKYTKHGYEISVVGESQNTARYAGMNVSKIVLRTMFISGAICGLAGMVQVSGNTYNLSDGIAGGVGFTAIIVAWLARLNPFVIVVITALFSILEKGSSVMQSAFGLSSAVSDILQGIILFVVLAVDFFTRYALVIRGGKEEQA